MVKRSGNAALKLRSLYKERTVERMEEMQNQELCILLDSLLALLETDNVDKAKEVIRNAINRIDKGAIR